MKRLFFSALVAIVAVGGALTVNAQYLPSGNTPINCVNVASPTCAAAYGVPGSTPIYDKPASDPTRKQIGTISQYSFNGE